MNCARRTRVRRPAAAAVIALAAVVLAGGCSPAPHASTPHPSTPHASPPQAGGGLAGYWDRSRLLGAIPLRERGYRLGRSRPAHPTVANLRVGALFEHDPTGNHFCTASVVDSPGQDLLITAAHCINGGHGGGYHQDIVFIPGYRDGQAPYGIWVPAHLMVAPQWISSSDPDLDVGFVVLKPDGGKNIEEVLGANHLAVDPGYRNQVRVTGYPASADAPITCVNWTSEQSPSQLRFECGGFTGGTSGSPWVTHFDPETDTGTIVGVLGGYQEGGSSAAISYSPYLGLQVQRLYRQAVAAEG